MIGFIRFLRLPYSSWYSFISSQLCPASHQQLAEMVFTDTVAYAPERVTPVVAFDQLGITGVLEGKCKLTLVELLGDQGGHDVDFFSFPVKGQLGFFAQTLGFSGRASYELSPLIDRVFCRLVCVLD